MKILIAGDSWAMGEWPEKQEDDIQHKGLEQYLIDDNHTVVNISMGGDPHNVILENLKTIDEKFDIAFVFTVDPHSKMEDENFWQKDFSYEDYYNRHKQAIRKFVLGLDKLNIGPIKLLGGSSKCLQEYTQDTSIEIAIPSIIELLIPGIKQYDMCFQYHHHLLDESINAEIVDKVYEQAKIFDSIFYKEPIMYPDGEHPNREGHYKIYEVLKDKYLHATTNN
tara:strand:+ start:1645 stop:2313 length:669 start_codon:yes stop_codon:yes gene_type:complete